MKSCTSKRPYVGIFLAFLALATPAMAGLNFWEAEGPFSGAITAIAVDPENPERVFAKVSSSSKTS